MTSTASFVERGPQRWTGRHSPRAWLAWLLILALPCLGWTSSLGSMLGARHVHQAKASPGPMAGWDDFRRGVATMTVAEDAHGHAHGVAASGGHGLQRHHHAVGDPTVVRMGGDDEQDSGTPGAAGTLVLAPPFTLSIGALTWVAARWRPAVSLRFVSWSPHQLDRPPRT